MIINQSTKSFRASLFWVERRTRPTRASLQYALQPHDQWAQISTSPEYTVEGVRNFAACGVSLSEYFAKFKALRFASWVIAGTSFDVLNAEKQSTQVAVDSLIHLGRYEDDNGEYFTVWQIRTGADFHSFDVRRHQRTGWAVRHRCRRTADVHETNGRDPGNTQGRRATRHQISTREPTSAQSRP
jgi:hypothetical protein